MTYVAFFGGLTVSLGLPLAAFILLIWPSDQLVILSVGGAFFWLLSLIAPAALWLLLPLKDGTWLLPVIYTVLSQELLRFAFYKLYMRAERVLRPVTESGTQTANRLEASLACGVGFGLMHVLVTYSAFLYDITGPGAIFAPACPSVNLMHVSGIIALCFFCTNVTLAFIAFDAYRQLHAPRGKAKLAAVVGAHMLLSTSTVLNTAAGSCTGSIAAAIVITVLSTLAALRTLQQTYVIRVR